MSVTPGSTRKRSAGAAPSKTRVSQRKDARQVGHRLHCLSRPSRMMPTRSESPRLRAGCATRGRWCVPRQVSRMIWCSTCCISGSRPVDGSSRMSNSGLWAQGHDQAHLALHARRQPLERAPQVVVKQPRQPLRLGDEAVLRPAHIFQPADVLDARQLSSRASSEGKSDSRADGYAVAHGVQPKIDADPSLGRMKSAACGWWSSCRHHSAPESRRFPPRRRRDSRPGWRSACRSGESGCASE